MHTWSFHAYQSWPNDCKRGTKQTLIKLLWRCFSTTSESLSFMLILMLQHSHWEGIPSAHCRALLLPWPDLSPPAQPLLFCPSITNKTLRKPNPNIHTKSKWFLCFFPASIPQNPQNRPLMNHYISLISLTGITYLLKFLEFATVPEVILLLEKQPARKLIM